MIAVLIVLIMSLVIVRELQVYSILQKCRLSQRVQRVKLQWIGFVSHLLTVFWQTAVRRVTHPRRNGIQLPAHEL